MRKAPRDNSGYIGIVRDGSVLGTKLLHDIYVAQHYELDPSIVHGRFRYLRRRKIILWTSWPPTQEEAITAEDWISRKQEPVTHHGCAFVYEETMPAILQ